VTAAVTTVVVGANPSSVALGVPSTITATTFNAANQPVQGVTLIFSTTLGNLTQPNPPQTGADGKTEVELTSTTDGSATVTATAPGGASGTVDVTITP
jgi:hypothetical protein